MEKKVENDGCYVEVNAKDVYVSFDRLLESEMCVVKTARFEFAGDDRDRFVDKLNGVVGHLEASGALDGLDNEQRSFLVLKYMLMS
jgi:hypothetical protein